MKNFSKFLLGFLGLVVLFMPNINPADLVRQYGTVSHLLPFLGMMIVLIAPSYPDNAQFLENFVPARTGTIIGVVLFFAVVTMFTMATNTGSLLYEHYIHSETGITFFATSFAMNMLAGAVICFIGIILFVLQKIRYASLCY